MSDQHFGEGLTRLGDKLYQITWLTNEGFIYSVPDLKQVCSWCCRHAHQAMFVLSNGSCHEAGKQRLLQDRSRSATHSNLLMIYLHGITMSPCLLALPVQVGTFQSPLQDGWGITTQGKLLVLSDGSSRLTWVDPTQGFKAVKSVVVKDGARSIGYLNEVGMVASGSCLLQGFPPIMQHSTDNLNSRNDSRCQQGFPVLLLNTSHSAYSHTLEAL
jgi:hypothetical protein